MTDPLHQINLLRAAGLADAPEEEQRVFLEQVSRVVLTRTADKVAASLAEDTRKRFFDLFAGESSDEDKIAFLKDHVPYFAETLIEETLKFKQEALEAMEKGGTEEG